MELCNYIKTVLDSSNASEITFEIRLNEECIVDDNGLHKIKFKLTRKNG